MTFEIKPGFREVRMGDPGFVVSNGLMTSTRASIEISSECPSDLSGMISLAYQNGWIETKVFFTEEEYTWLMLAQK